MEIEDEWVHFQIRHAFHPDPSDVLMRLFGRRLLQGRVLTTTPGRNAASYVVVSVPELDEPVVVPTDKVHQSLLGTHDAP